MSKAKKIRQCVVVLATVGARVVLVRNQRRKFELPGGGVEEGETAYRAALREFHEETGQFLVAESESATVLRGTPKPGADYDSEIHVLHGCVPLFEVTSSDAVCDEVDAVLLASRASVLLLHDLGALSDLDSRRVLLEWAGLTDGRAVASSIPVLDEGGGP